MGEPIGDGFDEFAVGIRKESPREKSFRIFAHLAQLIARNKMPGQ